MEVVAEVYVDCAVLIHEDRLTILMFLVSERVQRAAYSLFATTKEIEVVFDCADGVEDDVLVLISKMETAVAT